MSDQDEWGPWIEHDGKGCPCVGMWIEVTSHFNRIGTDVRTESGIPMINGFSKWDILIDGWCPAVIRYRIRKPKGLQLLTDILREVERDGDKVYSGGEMEEVK